MNILINFSTLKNGGGQNVAMNFLHAICEISLDNVNLYYCVAENSVIHNYLKKHHQTNYYTVPSNPIQRILFEIFFSIKVCAKFNIDIVYSYFGSGFFPRKIPQVSGSADSNLFFPEVDFWTHYRGFAKLKKKLVDLHRTWGLKRATAVIFENEALENRSHNLYNLTKTTTIKSSINFDFENKPFELPKAIKPPTPNGLFLCGWQLNKNIMSIPDIALELKKQSQEFHFLLSAPLDYSTVHKQFEAKTRHNNVQDMITIIGQVTKDKLASLYSQIDFVFLLSKLESFSNNIIESWYFQKPLIVADEIWAKAICKDAAIYVDRDSPTEVANVLTEHIRDQNKIQAVVEQGTQLLDSYPKIEERIQQEIEFVKNVFNNY